jgi:hypothetical protein
MLQVVEHLLHARLGFPSSAQREPQSCCNFVGGHRRANPVRLVLLQAAILAGVGLDTRLRLVPGWLGRACAANDQCGYSLHDEALPPMAWPSLVQTEAVLGWAYAAFQPQRLTTEAFSSLRRRLEMRTQPTDGHQRQQPSEGTDRTVPAHGGAH